MGKLHGQKMTRGQLTLCAWQMEMLTRQAFGRWIRKHRKHQSMKCKEAAKRAKIETGQWKRIEEGINENSKAVIRRVCAAVSANVKEGLQRYKR